MGGASSVEYEGEGCATVIGQALVRWSDRCGIKRNPLHPWPLGGGDCRSRTWEDERKWLGMQNTMTHTTDQQPTARRREWVDSIVQLTVAIAPRSQGQHGLRRWTRRTHKYSGSITCSSTSTLQYISTHLAMTRERGQTYRCSRSMDSRIVFRIAL